MHDDKKLPPFSPQVIVKLGELLKATMSESRVTYLDDSGDVRRGTLRHGLWVSGGAIQSGNEVNDDTCLRIATDYGGEIWLSLGYLTRKFLDSELMLEW